ncbi:MAG: aldo/keto reductase [Acidimicrobiales bacterium]
MLAHSPLGGPRRAPSLARRAALAEVATRHRCSAAAVALAWLGARSPMLVPIPGASRPDHIVDAAAAMRVTLSEPELAAIAGDAQPRRPAAVPVRRGSAATVQLLMGIPGAGKTRLATAAASDGAHRLNRDEQGGTLRTIAHALDAALADPTLADPTDPTGAIRAGGAARPRSCSTTPTCAHGGRPPRCWCRPPLPGLPLAFARTHGVDPARCTVIGTGRAHASLAAAIDATAQLVATA